ncbi:RNA polymerase sigma factor [Actomonas aquatica]|uniref:Sigma-70 family RNA polymerase sigma factor n=1 Tax=Actomonas aquatica TaxID=2866162 RepID=A0ABZ1C4P4_9BACT|nr:sigma-70 family RNA polymerase sigma factor [Opitutus sp. WL0086]WRQ86605.1 sigma-70 family RNA polymerase sigma factor [Opitutus sp. WL0086]
MNPTGNDEHAGSWIDEAVREHQAPLVRYATRLVGGDEERARDVVQDTFVRLLKQPPEQVNGHVVEWLYTVCRNRAMDVLRKEGRMRAFAEGEVEKVTTGEARPGRDLEAEERREAVLAMIDQLPANQQEVIRLKFQNGFSYKEISRITELSVSNVGFLIHTAVKKLRQEMAMQRP